MAQIDIPFGREMAIAASDGTLFIKFGTSTTWLVPHVVTVVPEAGS